MIVGIAVATMVLSTAAMNVPIRQAASTSVRRESAAGSAMMVAAVLPSSSSMGPPAWESACYAGACHLRVRRFNEIASALWASQ